MTQNTAGLDIFNICRETNEAGAQADEAVYGPVVDPDMREGIPTVAWRSLPNA